MMKRSHIVFAAAIVLAASTSVTATPAGADTQPWRNTAQSPAARAAELIGAMSHQQQVDLVTGDYADLAALGVPPLNAADASGGVRGASGVTAFPVPEALAATFDTQLAQEYGGAIGAEARAKGYNLLLGPTVDIARTGLSGRQAEAFGEDPVLSGQIGANVALGMRGQNEIATVKHYTAYTQEPGRTTLNAVVSDRALHEIYDAPFDSVITTGKADMAMCAYPQVNGTYACQNTALLNGLRNDTGFQGAITSDFQAGTDNVAGFNAGVDTTTLWPNFPTSAFTNGSIPAARVRQAATNIAFSLFDSGVFDHPLGAPDSGNVSTTADQGVAATVAQESSVLLKNSGILPLPKNSTKKIALIGPTGEDAITGVEGSSYVTPQSYPTPAAAITSAAGSSATVTTSQGTLGDVALPVVPSSALLAPDGSHGLLGTYYGTGDYSGSVVAQQDSSTLDFTGSPVSSLPATWSAKFTGKLIPTATATGLVRLSALTAGAATVKINGTTVVAGSREFANFEFGPYNYPLQGTVDLAAGQPVSIEVDYSTVGAGFFGNQLHLGWQSSSLIAAAAAAAKAADVAIVWVNQASGEGMDRDASLSLPGDENQLVSAVTAANPNTIVVLNTPGAVVMPWLSSVKAVLQVWYPGIAVGSGPAAALFGDVDPSGRLPVTFPASSSQGVAGQGAGAYPGVNGTVNQTEGIDVGYRYFQTADQTPLFPFGYGLSYATYAFSAASAGSLSASGTAPTVPVTFTVTNTSARAGTAVAQVYLGQLPTSAAATPPRSLAGFARVTLGPGATKTITVNVPRRSLQYWDTSTQRWTTPQGTILAYVGTSSADTPLSAPITVTS